MRDDPFFRDTHIIGQYLACPLLVHVDAYPKYVHGLCAVQNESDSRTSFPNELLSLEQNKDAPGLNKAMTIWIFGGGLPLPAI